MKLSLKLKIPLVFVSINLVLFVCLYFASSRLISTNFRKISRLTINERETTALRKISEYEGAISKKTAAVKFRSAVLRFPIYWHNNYRFDGDSQREFHDLRRISELDILAVRSMDGKNKMVSEKISYKGSLPECGDVGKKGGIFTVSGDDRGLWLLYSAPTNFRGQIEAVVTAGAFVPYAEFAGYLGRGPLEAALYLNGGLRYSSLDAAALAGLSFLKKEGSVSLAGKKYFYRKVDLAGGVLSAVFLSSGAEYSALGGRLSGLILLLFGVAFAATAAAGLLVTRRILRPLTNLERAAARLAEGNFNTRVAAYAGDETGRLVGAFNLMAEKLKNYEDKLVLYERIYSWRQTAKKLIHEVSNPMQPLYNNIRGLDEALDSESKEELHKRMALLSENILRVRELLRELSGFASERTLHAGFFDLKEMALELKEMYAKGGAPLAVNYLTDSRQVFADKNLIRQALINLVNNAGAAAAGGTVNLEIARPEERGAYIIKVTDNGPGISPENMKNIFDPYFTTKSGGKGLGLTITYEIVSAHHGGIKAESRPGLTQFIINLPSGEL